MQWKANIYYKDPADNQVNDCSAVISDWNFVEMLRHLRIDPSIIDHTVQVEFKQIENYPPTHS